MKQTYGSRYGMKVVGQVLGVWLISNVKLKPNINVIWGRHVTAVWTLLWVGKIDEKWSVITS